MEKCIFVKMENYVAALQPLDGRVFLKFLGSFNRCAVSLYFVHILYVADVNIDMLCKKRKN